jgi:DNA-binding NtrC family response regulator
LTRFNAEFRKTFRRIDDAALRLLVGYAWPGNVRELKNLVERILILEKGDVILAEHLPPEITTAAPAAVTAAGAQFVLPAGGVKLEDVENDLVRQALAQSDGNQTRAAQLLGISRDSLRYRMQKLASEG